MRKKRASIIRDIRKKYERSLARILSEPFRIKKLQPTKLVEAGSVHTKEITESRNRVKKLFEIVMTEKGSGAIPGLIAELRDLANLEGLSDHEINKRIAFFREEHFISWPFMIK